MLTKNQLRILILKRVLACSDSCNSYHRNHVQGQIRALVSVYTGKPFHNHNDLNSVLDAIDIKYDNSKDDNWQTFISDEEAAKNGFKWENNHLIPLKPHPIYDSW